MDKHLDIILPIGFIIALITMAVGNEVRTKDIAALELRLDTAELALAAKVKPKIKFYTIPGYKCDTSNIAGYCSNMYPVTQAEYDKKNSHLFKVTE